MAMAMLTQSAMGFAPAMTAGNSAAARASVKMETISDLKVLATNLNPVVGFWDPLKRTCKQGYQPHFVLPQLASLTANTCVSTLSTPLPTFLNETSGAPSTR